MTLITTCVNKLDFIRRKQSYLKNDYIIENNVVKIILNNLDRPALIDLADLPIVERINSCFYAGYYKEIDEYYAQVTQYIDFVNGKEINKTLRLQDIIIGKENIPKGFKIDHRNHNGLDDTRDNLRVISASDNSSNRKGANKNNNTGARNVSYIKDTNTYRVQVMKNYVRYKRDFSVNQFQEACEYAKQLREELFGEFAGNS